MTLYVHNPPEPHAVPTQPVPNISTSDFVYLPRFTTGRCGQCVSCPKIWQLDAPSVSGGGNQYAGTYYLFKIPFKWQSTAPLVDVNDCSWGTRENERLQGANQSHQWILKFEYTESRGFRWAIYSPIVDGGNPARWEFRGNSESEFRCLRPNAFDLQKIQDSNFSYQPDTLTITPFHA